MTETNMSFRVVGTVSHLGDWAHGQILFGLIDDDTTDWLTSFDQNASSWTDGSENARTTSSLYSLQRLPYSDSILTSGETWVVGDQMDISFNFVGQFNTSNFDVNNFGMQVGYSNTSIVSSVDNILEGTTSSVPEPSSMALLGMGVFGLFASRRRKKS
ncbi:MAG: PEP-CTERM sorting domain-containing protein [Planctomycetes bacterium]|nr:PEP-CTERM sorting domain-containing protein [Planctomycetota bacterium]